MNVKRPNPIDNIHDLEVVFLLNTGALIAIVIFFSLIRPYSSSSTESEYNQRLLEHRSVSDLGPLPSQSPCILRIIKYCFSG